MGNRSSSSSITTAANHRQLEGLLRKLHELLELGQLPMYANHVKKLWLFWRRLKHLIDCVKQWSDADAVVRDCGSLVVRVEATADALVNLLSTLNLMEYSGRKQQQLPSSLTLMMEELQVRACRFYRLDQEIALVVDSISENFSSLKIYSPLCDISLWTEFAHSTAEMLVCLELSSVSSLAILASFISRVHKEFGLKLIPMSGDEKVVIEGFFAHVAPLVYRAAYLCCCPLIEPTRRDSLLTGIFDEISFANLKFLDFTLKFLKALTKTGYDPTSLVQLFLSSCSCSQSRETLFHEELRDMVIYIINTPEPINEEDKCDLAEIKLLVVDAILAPSEKGELQFHSSRSTVESMIWLRKVGLSLKEQHLSSGEIFKHPEEDKIEYLVNCLIGLRWYYAIKKDILTEEVAGELKLLKSLYKSFCDKRIDGYKVRISISRLVSKVALLRAKPALMKLLNHNETVIANCKNELCLVLEYIELFISSLTIVEVENAVDEEKKSVAIESLCMKALHVCFFLSTEHLGTETIKETVERLLDEMQMVERQIILQIPKTNFPNRSAGMEFFDRLLRNQLELCKRENDPFFRDHLEKFQMELESFRINLRGSSQEGYELLEWKDLGACVSKFTYELEYIIDSIELQRDTRLQHILWLNNLHTDIISIKVLAATKLQEKTSEDRDHHITKNSSSTARAGEPQTDRLVVWLRDQEEVIIDRLTRGSPQRDLVCIFGMPGLGKTTLAKKLYDHPEVLYHFHRRAWCFVSQSYEKRNLLLKLLEDTQGITDEIHAMDDGDLELKLWRCLKRNRYLIVLDAVWDAGVWKDLQTSFPDDRNGSRIMITSRLFKVSLEAMPGSNPHQLRTLSVDECWKLLEMRTFHEEGCPKELVQLGKEIAEQCKGLALAVVAVAGMLAKLGKKQGSWQQILQELHSQVIDDPETQCKSILEMSYSHLPDHLKACFLYFGALQQDRDVKVKKLIQMWIAEGFIQKTDQKSLEEEGEDYLKDLIDRSLVMVSKRKSTGGVKTCQIHDLLFDLCLSKCKEENFLQLVTRYDDPYASFHDLYDGVDFDYDGHSNAAIYEGYRVCTYLKRKHFVDSRPSGPCARSLIFMPSNDAYSRRPFNLSFICENFILLRVLDLECINLGISFPVAIEFLVLLRYLAISGDIDSIPESISKLWKLETFILQGLSGKVVLPDSFWCMASLLHVHVKNQAVFNLLGDKFGGSFLLDNLVTFSSPSLSYGKDTEKILGKLPNLLKLKCIFLESRDSSGNCNPFPTLDSLIHLESLNILYAGRARSLGEFNLPLNLRKLTLSRFRLSWNHMSTIGRLPNLEVLKLLSASLEGLTWEMKEEEFQKLKFLKLDSLNIVRWIASSDHLPKLEHLVFWNCRDLEYVPYEFSEISTLQIIEVQRCSQSLEDSVRNIEESMEGLQVLISHWT